MRKKFFEGGGEGGQFLKIFIKIQMIKTQRSLDKKPKGGVLIKIQRGVVKINVSFFNFYRFISSISNPEKRFGMQLMSLSEGRIQVLSRSTVKQSSFTKKSFPFIDKSDKLCEHCSQIHSYPSSIRCE